MAFGEFIYEQGIIGVTIGTITGFAISGFIKDLNNEVIRKLLKRFRISNIGLLSSLFEFIALMLIVYILYHTILFPIFKTHIEKEKIQKNKHKEWKENVLHEVKNLDIGNVYM